MEFNKLVIAFGRKIVENGSFNFSSDKLDWKIENFNTNGDSGTSYDFSITKQCDSIERGTRNILVTDGTFQVMSSSRPQLCYSTMYLRGTSTDEDNDSSGDYMAYNKFGHNVYSAMVTSMMLSGKSISEGRKEAMKVVCETMNVNVEDVTMLCGACKKVLPYSNDVRYCDDCAKETYTCSACGEKHVAVDVKYVENKDGTKLCVKCMRSESRHHDSNWKDYSDKPSPKFFGEGRYYGCEVEVEYNSENEDLFSKSDTARYLSSQYDHLYFKNDGSLNNGVEVITYPCTIDYHKDNTTKVLKTLDQLEYIGDTTCGLHIHVSKDVFGDTIEKKATNIGKLLMISIEFYEQLKAISLRTKFDYCTKNNRPGEREESEDYFPISRLALIGSTVGNIVPTFEEEALSYFKHFFTVGSRYKVINLYYRPTVEFRLPQCVLNPNEYMAFLQLYDVMVDIAISDIDFRGKDFLDLFMGKYSELDEHIVKYLIDKKEVA